MGALFERYAPWLRRRASGRLPQWARSGAWRPAISCRTCCITPSHGSSGSSRSTSAPCASISGAPWRTASRPAATGHPPSGDRPPRPGEPLRPFEDAAPQYRQLLHDEMWGRYREGLKRLKVGDRRLIVGRAELGYNYAQLAAIERLPSPTPRARRSSGPSFG